MTDKLIDKTAIRNAATVIALRHDLDEPHVLMGQRGAKAAFMPNKFVFPGGAVDAGDALVPLAGAMPEPCLGRIQEAAGGELAHAISVAVIRELWEETGLVLGQKGTWDTPPPEDWAAFADAGYVPTAAGLQFVFRAITPPGRPRRFDARFFLIDADEIQSDLDDFSRAEDELSHLQWIPLPKVREFDLPFITEVVLAEVSARGDSRAAPETVPFFENNDEGSFFRQLKGNVERLDRPD